ncbi:unnamed protein product [Urochloa humidicola]
MQVLARVLLHFLTDGVASNQQFLHRAAPTPQLHHSLLGMWSPLILIPDKEISNLNCLRTVSEVSIKGCNIMCTLLFRCQAKWEYRGPSDDSPIQHVELVLAEQTMSFIC